MRLLSPFRRLQWKLTLSYTIVTTLASAVLMFVFLAAVGTAIFRSDELPIALAEATAAKTEEVRAAVLADDQAEIQRWLTELKRRDIWRIINTGSFQYSVNLGEDGDAMMVVVDETGQVLGTNRVSTIITPMAVEPTLLARALAGESDPQKLFARDPRHLLAIAPIFDNAGQVAGAVVARTEVLDDSEQTFWLVAVIGSLTPALCVFMPLAAIIGLFFGFFSARGLTRRIAAVTRASASWSGGDFSHFVNDSSGDELGQLARRLNTMAQQLQTLLQNKQDLAVLEERNRLALDLHDSVKQQAFAASAQLGAARALLKTNPPAAEARLADAEQLMDDLRQELAHLIMELRPPALADKGLLVALGDYIPEWSRQNGITVELHTPETFAATPEIEQALFRVAQEALANATRHSGATQLQIELTHTASFINLTLSDNGRGFDPVTTRKGVGLSSMHERIAALNGTLTIESAVGQGTRIRAVLRETFGVVHS